MFTLSIGQVTIANTMHLHAPGIPLGIGGPTPNNTVYILDENMKACNIGDTGVMWAGGAGVTRGYLNLSEKTNEKYQLDPFLNDGCVSSLSSYAKLDLQM